MTWLLEKQVVDALKNENKILKQETMKVKMNVNHYPRLIVDLYRKQGEYQGIQWTTGSSSIKRQTKK